VWSKKSSVILYYPNLLNGVYLSTAILDDKKVAGHGIIHQQTTIWLMHLDEMKGGSDGMALGKYRGAKRETGTVVLHE